MILLSIVHDPEGHLLTAAEQHLTDIVSLFDGAVFNTTSQTDKRVQELLSSLTIYNRIEPAQGISNARRQALQDGLDCTIGNHFFYCDIDRLLHWQITYPDELMETLPKVKMFDFTVLCRTRLAWRSHPLLQRVTEWLCNFTFSTFKMGGYYVDILAATRGISREVANAILNTSKARGCAVDAEWPAIARAGNWDVADIYVNGLGYESTGFDIRKGWKEEVNMRIGNVLTIMQVALQ